MLLLSHGLGFDPLSATEFNQLFSLFNFTTTNDANMSAHTPMKSILRISMNTLFVKRYKHAIYTIPDFPSCIN